MTFDYPTYLRSGILLYVVVIAVVLICLYIINILLSHTKEEQEKMENERLKRMFKEIEDNIKQLKELAK